MQSCRRIAAANQSVLRGPFDFDGDGKTDVSIFRPSTGEWWYSRSSDDLAAAARFGTSTDRITPGDFTGDGKTDIAFFRPSTGFWFILRSENGSFFSFPFGTTGDIPAPADYDADGRTDAAVFRPSNSTWFILRSSNGGVTINQFGTAGDVPVTADYDGDGRSDIAIYRPSVSEWWIVRSTAGLVAVQFGAPGDKALPGRLHRRRQSGCGIFPSREWFLVYPPVRRSLVLLIPVRFSGRHSGPGRLRWRR